MRKLKKYIGLILLDALLIILIENILYINNSYVTSEFQTSENTTKTLPNTADNKSCDVHLKTCTCIDRTQMFRITYPLNWTRSGLCTFFSPTTGELFPTTGEIYVRISVSNLSIPVTSISDLANNILFFTDSNLFHLIGQPVFGSLNGNNAFQVEYSYDKNIVSSQDAIPFANPFSIDTPSPIVTPFSIPSSNPVNTTTTTTTTQSNSPTTNKAVPLSNNTTKPTSIMQLYAIYVLTNNKIYVIEYNAPIEQYNNYLGIAREITNSFSLIR